MFFLLFAFIACSLRLDIGSLEAGYINSRWDGDSFPSPGPLLRLLPMEMHRPAEKKGTKFFTTTPISRINLSLEFYYDRDWRAYKVRYGDAPPTSRRAQPGDLYEQSKGHRRYVFYEGGWKRAVERVSANGVPAQVHPVYGGAIRLKGLEWKGRKYFYTHRMLFSCYFSYRVR